MRCLLTVNPKKKKEEFFADIFNDAFISKNNGINENDEDISYLNKKRYFIDSISENKEGIIGISNDNSKSQRTTRDYYLKAFFSNFLNTYLFNRVNSYLDIPIFENCRIYKCDYIKNIGNSIERNLKQFLTKNIENTFTIYDETKPKGAEKLKNNIKVFEIIKEKFKDVEIEKELVDFQKFYYLSIEEHLKDYYYSKEFEAFKNETRKNGKTIKDYDFEFSHAKKRKRPSLLIPYGFIDYAKSKPYCHNQRRKLKMNLIELKYFMD